MCRENAPRVFKFQFRSILFPFWYRMSSIGIGVAMVIFIQKIEYNGREMKIWGMRQEIPYSYCSSGHGSHTFLINLIEHTCILINEFKYAIYSLLHTKLCRSKLKHCNAFHWVKILNFIMCRIKLCSTKLLSLQHFHDIS